MRTPSPRDPTPPPFPGLLAAALVLLGAATATAQPPPGYYDTVDTSYGTILHATLHEVIDDHIRFPYTSANTDTWDILEMAQEDPAVPASILDAYLNASFVKAGGGNDDYQREHTWPNSYGFPDDLVSNYPYTDCHALFLAYDSYNASRGRMPYRYCDADCDERATEANNGQGGSPGTGYPGWSNWREGLSASNTGTWEVWLGRRGDIARALFYLDVRYEGGFHGTTGHPEPDLILTDDQDQIVTFPSNTTGAAYMGIRSDLLAWHLEDPIDAYEVDRNEVVASFQGNRNPFVDHPEWVECIWGTTCPIFADGFESGDFGAWTATVP